MTGRALPATSKSRHDHEMRVAARRVATSSRERSGIPGRPALVRTDRDPARIHDSGSDRDHVQRRRRTSREPAGSRHGRWKNDDGRASRSAAAPARRFHQRTLKSGRAPRWPPLSEMSIRPICTPWSSFA